MRTNKSEFREFLVVLRRAMLLIIAWIDQTTE